MHSKSSGNVGTLSCVQYPIIWLRYELTQWSAINFSNHLLKKDFQARHQNWKSRKYELKDSSFLKFDYCDSEAAVIIVCCESM